MRNRRTPRNILPALLAVTLLATGSMLVLILVPHASADTPATGPTGRGGVTEDMQRVQGTWERVVRPEEKVPYVRVLKQVDGDRETVTYFKADGTVHRKHTVEFKLESRGGVKVFTFWNQEITDGPDKGKKFAQPKSFIYRLTKDTFDEVWGFLPGQEGRPIEYHVHHRASVADAGRAQADRPSGNAADVPR